MYPYPCLGERHEEVEVTRDEEEILAKSSAEVREEILAIGAKSSAEDSHSIIFEVFFEYF